MVGTVKKPPLSGGIRIVRAHPQKESVENIPQPGTQRPAEEIWASYLTEAEGDIDAGGELLGKRILDGKLEAGRAVGAYVEYAGVSALSRTGLYSDILLALQQQTTKVPLAGLTALDALTSIVKTGTLRVEPSIFDALPLVLFCSAKVKEHAVKVGENIARVLNPHASSSLVQLLLSCIPPPEKSMSRASSQTNLLHKSASVCSLSSVSSVSSTGGSSKLHWHSRSTALAILAARAKYHPESTGRCLPDIVPIVSEAMVDGRPEVAAAAHRAMLACALACGNRDLEPHIEAIVSCMSHPEEAPTVVAKLSATTFVQAIEAPTLALLAPLALRALRDRSAKTQRRAAIIVENVSKLVAEPQKAADFLPPLIPEFESIARGASDPELRDVAARARTSLVQIQEEAAHSKSVNVDYESVVSSSLQSLLQEEENDTAIFPAIRYVTALVQSLAECHIRGPRSWDRCIVPYLPSCDTISQTSAELRRKILGATGELPESEEEEEEDPAGELCNCEFSLAYGGRILLTNATLHLKRGRRYGLCGANGIGKSTLMRAIASGQLDGFPPQDELRTVYVAADIDASHAETNGVDFIFGDAAVQAAVQPTREQIQAALEAVGFTPELYNAPLGSLSGGWKMKLALARAVLMRADLLLLDEPTNHLDTTNVAWLQEHLCSLSQASALIVSHDSGFLDTVCTDIVHYANKKLTLHHGNLSAFVEKHPEARSYYELESVSFKFHFPDPGFLDGIKGKTQSVIKIKDVGFTYPGATRRQLEDVSVRVTLGSRVAVIGRNGAGKSTLIKILTGEMLPSSGIVWKHPNVRVAYVAQHAFHHIEQHLDQSPSEYIWWRFGTGEDLEAKQKVTRKVTEEEQRAREEAIAAGKRVVEMLNSRRMGKKEYEYEVVWVGQGPDQNKWLSRSELCSEQWNLSKMVEDKDAELAAYRLYRPLSKPVVLSHLKDFGLDEEISAHNRIRGLSGGQKVKLVLAAAMWNLPHILVLDEPTNYLDRDSLGALAAGIKDFNGGVIMISHNSEFTSALCAEDWLVEDGRVMCKGGKTMVPSASVASLASSHSALEENGAQEEDLDEMLRLKTERRAEKQRLAAEKAAKKAERAKLRYSKKF